MSVIQRLGMRPSGSIEREGNIIIVVILSRTMRLQEGMIAAAAAAAAFMCGPFMKPDNQTVNEVSASVATARTVL